MIVAQKWYCIAQTTSIGSSSGIKVEFGNYYRLLLNASVDWGNAVISIQFSNISKDIVASVRLRNNGQYFYLDIKLSKPFDTDFSTSLYDNSSWNLASSVSDLSGVPICIIDDINSLNTSQTGGESYFVEDENGDLHPIPKEDGTARGIYTDSYISSGGKNPNTEGGGGGGFTEFIIKFDDVEVNPEGYMSVDGVVTLPNYPSLDGYLLKDTADNLYQAKGDYATKEELNTLDKYIKSLFTAEYDENNVLISIKANAGLWTNQYLSSGGKNANAGGEGGGVTSFDIMFEGDNVSRYPLEDGIVTLPAYPTMPDVSGFILKTTADLLYQPKGNYLTSIPSEYITETELSNALSPYLLSQTAADTYATIDALNTHRADYTAFKTNTNERLQSLEDMFEWDDDGHIHAKAGLYTDSFLSSGGKNTTEGTTGGGLTEFSVIFNGTQYDSSNGVATIDGTYATSDAVNDAIATSKSYTDTSIANLINGAPSTLDTLKEIADAMAANENVVDALEEAIGTKASQTELNALSGRVSTAEADIATLKTNVSTNAAAINTNKTAITTLQGYFTNGIAKEAAKVSNIFKITFNGTTYEYNGSAAKEINFSATNIVSALGTTPVNRAKGDESGNNIKSTYATKTALQEFIDKIEKYFTFGEDNIKANYGLWTDSYLSAGGQNSSAGGTGGIDIQAMWDALAASSNEQIHINHIPDLSSRYLKTSDVYDWAKAATKPTYTKSEVGLGNVDNTSDSSKVVKAVIDYNDATRTVYIGYAGTGLTATNATHLAAYSRLSDGRQVIKDLSIDNAKTWLGLGDLAYLSSISWNKITSDKPTTLAGYGITDKVAYRETENNFMHSTNEFTFAAPAYSSYIWMNYRTASGSLDGAITEYRFAKGAGATYADIRAAKYIVNDGASSQFLKADGSLDGTSYLPLSGGTVTGLVTFATNEISLDGLYLAYSSGALRVRTQSGDSWFGMMNDTACHIYTDASLFYMNKPLKVDNGYDVIHSGNYSNYALPINLNIPFESTVNAYGYGYTSGGWATSGSALIVGANSLYRMAIQGESNNTLLYRYCYNGTWGKERYFAFTDSNVASATKLQTARTIWGQSFDGTGDINSGINVSSYFNNNSVTKVADLGNKGLAITVDDHRNNWGMCFWTEGNGKGMIQQQAFTSAATTYPIVLQPFGGTVLIGTTTDAGYKFAVNGSALANAVRTSELRLGSADPSSGITQNKWYYASITYEYTDVSPATLKPDIIFKTMYDTYEAGSGVERMRIKSNGNVGINTNAPTSTLHVNGSFRAGSSVLDSLTVNGSATFASGYRHFTRTGNTSYNSGWLYGTNGQEAMAFINNAAVSSFMFVQGKTAIENWDTGTWQSVTPALQIKQNCVAINYLWGQNVTPDYTLRVEGSAYFSGNISASGDIIAFNSSDARLKDNITTISDDRAIDILSRLNPVTFAWNEIATSLSSRLQGDSQGFIAQEWEKIIPNASGTMWGKYKGIDYIQTIPYLTKGWQIHETKIQRLEREIKELKDKLAKYESIS